MKNIRQIDYVELKVGYVELMQHASTGHFNLNYYSKEFGSLGVFSGGATPWLLDSLGVLFVYGLSGLTGQSFESFESVDLSREA